MILQPVITKVKRDRFLVIETNTGIAVKKGKEIYQFHPLMLLISDRCKVYASKYNDHHSLYYEHERKIKDIANELSAIKYWIPYKPKQIIRGDIVNNEFYDSKRASQLKSISNLYELLKDK